MDPLYPGYQNSDDIKSLSQPDYKFRGLMDGYHLIYDYYTFGKILKSFQSLGGAIPIQNHDFDNEIKDLNEKLQSIIKKVSKFKDSVITISLNNKIEEVKTIFEKTRKYESSLLSAIDLFSKSFSSFQAKLRKELSVIQPKYESTWWFPCRCGKKQINQTTLNRLAPIFYGLSKMWELYLSCPNDSIALIQKKINEEKNNKKKFFEYQKKLLNERTEEQLKKNQEDKKKIYEEFQAQIEKH